MVPRRAAEPRLAAVAVPLPADGFPVPAAGRGERPPVRDEPEFELLDTGVFDEDRYWSVDVTYAKASPTEVLARITVENHGPDEATLSVLPTLWFRNTWRVTGEPPPALSLDGDGIAVDHPRLGGYRLDAAPTADGVEPVAVFCDNETNTERLFGSASVSAYPKDGINDHVVSGAPTVNPDRGGTKAAWWYRLTVPAGGTAEVRLRLHRPPTGALAGRSNGSPRADWSGAAFDETITTREREADEFYTALAPDGTDPERMRVLRQACAGLIWSKQMYPYRVNRWLDGDPGQPEPPAGHRTGRNAGWRHLDAFDVLAMPDPWEYPWFAAWDLAFHTVPWAHLDPAFAKYQLLVLLREWFQHPNGALPAYEWNFDDVNPPVHALAALRVFVIDGSNDYDFLERVFQKLLLNFTWWLNRQDPDGNNLFGGGFLGLDNISPIDRSHLPPGMRLEQADGTAWMAYYSIAMLTLAVTLADRNPVYEDMVVKFAEHSVLIMDALESSGCYDPVDGFFYDLLTDASGNSHPIRVQTLVGVIPALPAIAISATDGRTTPGSAQAVRPAAGAQGPPPDPGLAGPRHRRHPATAAVRRPAGPAAPDPGHPVRRGRVPVPARPAGRVQTAQHPLLGARACPDATIRYEPAESSNAMYGGNSNWRGPVWFPINYLIIRELLQYDQFLGPDFTLEYPTGSGRRASLRDVAGDLSDRLIGIWLPDPDGRRPVYGGRRQKLQTDPAWKDNLLFFEYFHGDNGAGLGRDAPDRLDRDWSPTSSSTHPGPASASCSPRARAPPGRPPSPTRTVCPWRTRRDRGRLRGHGRPARARRGAAAVGVGPVPVQLRRFQHERDDQRHQHGPGHHRPGRAGRDHPVPAGDGRVDDPRRETHRPVRPNPLPHRGSGPVRDRRGGQRGVAEPDRADHRELDPGRGRHRAAHPARLHPDHPAVHPDDQPRQGFRRDQRDGRDRRSGRPAARRTDHRHPRLAGRLRRCRP